MKYKYCFIAVNFNNAHYTKEYVKSINQIELHEDEQVEIIIVDNNSMIEDLTELEKLAKDINGNNITLIKLKENIGYFPALNQGIECIKDISKYQIIVGNNDMTFDKNFICKLKKISFDKSTFVLSPKIITYDGYHQNPYYINPVSKIRKIAYGIYFSNYYIAMFMQYLTKKYRSNKETTNKRKIFNKPMFIHMGHGSCYVLTRNFFHNFERLDNRIFLWGEEPLLSGQVKSRSGKILYTPDLIVYHNRSTSVNKLPSKEKFKIMKKSYSIYSKYL